ncbi:MAG: MerR family transcriptional regulator [Planctomycetes bacterium]|nr:MerR family transcriptional regulator [Planctomycetota bacterium]
MTAPEASLKASPTAPVRIGSLARRLGLTPRALRYWEARGLLPPPHRTRGGSRVYGADHVEAARGVMQLKRAGFALDEICSVQDSLRRSRTALAGMGGLAEALADREEQVRAMVADLTALQAELAAARESVLRCDGCQGKTLDTECISCLHERSGAGLPCCLRSLLAAAAPAPGGAPA